MPKQNPVNDDIAAYVLELDGRTIDKFLGMTGFMHENPSELMETFPGTVVGTETNSLTNKVTFNVMVHSQSDDRIFLQKLIRTGKFVSCKIYMEKNKRPSDAKYPKMVVEQSFEGVLVKGGGTPMGGKNNGPITYNLEGMNSKTVLNDGTIDEDSLTA